MVEEKIDLGDQRLLVSKHLGNEFQAALEGTGEVSEEMAETIESVKKHLSEKTNARLIGYKVREGDDFSNIEQSLFQQMGLLPSAKIGQLKDRVAGSEERFLLVILGTNNLSPEDQQKTKKEIKKLGLNSIIT